MKKLISMLLVLSVVMGVCCIAQAGGNAADMRVYSGYTTLHGSSQNKIYNVELAARRLNGYVLRAGETFSFNSIVGPRTQEYGYRLAENGRGVKVRGGGAAQLATTVYRALLQAGVAEFIDLQFYGDRFNDTYAASGDEAVLVDYASGDDLSFFNTLGDMTFYITKDAYGVTCTVSVNHSTSHVAPGTLIARASTALVSGDAQKNNAMLAAGSISGVQLSYGHEFSFNTVVGPRTQAAGYVRAVNGRGAKVLGGGSAQAASTLYLAVQNISGVYITEKHTYGDKYNQTYVTFPEDAIMVDYNSESDFRFAYYGSGVLNVVMYEVDGILFCDVYKQ